MLFPLSIATTYFLNYYLIPRFLFTKKYARFTLFAFYTLVVSIWVELIITLLVFVFFGNYKMHKMDPTSFDAVFLFVGLYFIIFVATALILIQHSFEIQKSNNLLNSKKYETELKLKEAELKLLKAQIHPHFLFNTLNNLYGLTLEKSEEAPSLVLRLSEILDYILYRCEEKYVPLSEELNNLKSYIEIEKIRYSDKLNLQLDFPENVDKFLIAPLILLPYVENSFKHGVSKHSGASYIKMKIHILEKNLVFSIENSNSNSEKNETYTHGIGLNNVKKRLDLMYSEKYILSISNKPESFSVDLTLQLES
jgi:LytS/YehU family sensor histidine kinase